MKFNQEELNILRRIWNKPDSTQRKIALELKLSLGKINYCLKALRKKGLVKLKNFSNNSNKSNYLYILTAKGILEKTKMTLNFMKKKMKEYDELKEELNDKNNKK